MTRGAVISKEQIESGFECYLEHGTEEDTMYVIAEFTATHRHIHKSFDSFNEAVDFAKANYPIVHFELDADVAEAADFFTKFGTVYAIEKA